MAIPKRGSGVPPRSVGGKGGEIAVHNTDCSLPNEVSSSVKRLVIGEGLGFTAYVDADDEGCIIIGQPPNFLPPLWQMDNQTSTIVRVGLPDGGNFFAGLNDNWAGTARTATQNTSLTWTSGQSTGFGSTSSVNVNITDGGLTPYANLNFPTAGNSDTTTGRVRVRVTGTTADGDGSRNAATIAITVDLQGLLDDAGNGHTSGSFRVRFTHTDFDGTQRVFEESFFLDDNNNADIFINPNATGLREFHIERVQHGIGNGIVKYLSGIGYYTTGTRYSMTTGVVENHNLDSSRVDQSYVFDMDGFGVADYNTSPWTSVSDFQLMLTDVDRFDNQMGYVPDDSTNTINRANFRHIGFTQALVNVRDAWGSSPQYPSPSFNMMVDTFTDDSTNLIETFNGETLRLEGDYATPWDSETIRADGHAIVFGGGLYRGVDLPTIDENVLGVTGSLGDASAFFPDKFMDDSVRPQPNYSTHAQKAVYFREFRANNPTTSYGSMTFTITTENGIETDINAGNVEIYIWKLGSSAPTSPNLVLPPTYDPANPDLSKVNSIWLHEPYDFGNFDDGATQNVGTNGCLVNIAGSTLTATFGGANVEGGVLVRIDISGGARIDHIVAAF